MSRDHGWHPCPRTPGLELIASIAQNGDWGLALGLAMPFRHGHTPHCCTSTQILFSFHDRFSFSPLPTTTASWARHCCARLRPRAPHHHPAPSRSAPARPLAPVEQPRVSRVSSSVSVSVAVAHRDLHPGRVGAFSAPPRLPNSSATQLHAAPACPRPRLFWHHRISK